MEMYITEAWDLLLELLQVPLLPVQIGAAVATAMVIGGILVEDFREFWRWGIVVVVFITFTEWMRNSILLTIGNAPAARPVALSALSFLIFGAGLGMGILIRFAAKRHFSKERKELEDTLRQLRDTSIDADIREIINEVLQGGKP